MIQRTRRKFIAVTMALLALVLVLIGAAVVIVMQAQDSAEVAGILSKALDSLERQDLGEPEPGAGGWDPGAGEREPDARKPFNDLRSFTARVSADGQTELDFREDFYEREQLLALVEKIAASGRESGRMGALSYLTRTAADGSLLIAATDRTIEREMFAQTALTIGVIGLAGLGLLYLIVWRLSHWIIRPVQEAFDRQKRFVSDAGHELKTPLTVLSANAEVLRAENGDSLWLNNVDSQIARMTGLVQELLQLAKLDEAAPAGPAREFDAAPAVRDSVLPFDALAFEAGKSIESSLIPEAACHGSEEDFKRIVGILTDNAVVHSDGKSPIRVRLIRRGGRVRLEVENSGCTVPPKDSARMFERFYRGDASRDRASGGNGLGLSIAMALAERNRWELSAAVSAGGNVVFTLALS